MDNVVECALRPTSCQNDMSIVRADKGQAQRQDAFLAGGEGRPKYEFVKNVFDSDMEENGCYSR